MISISSDQHLLEMERVCYPYGACPYNTDARIQTRPIRLLVNSDPSMLPLGATPKSALSASYPKPPGWSEETVKSEEKKEKEKEKSMVDDILTDIQGMIQNNFIKKVLGILTGRRVLETKLSAPAFSKLSFLWCVLGLMTT